MLVTNVTIGKVFVPGGMPKLTYVPRTERHLESSLAEVQDNLCKLVVVTGATKTGKTVLVKKVLDGTSQTVWLDGGNIESFDGFLDDCLHALGVDLIVEKEDATNHEIAGKVAAKSGGKFLGFGAEVSGEGGGKKGGSQKIKVKPSGTKQNIVLSTLESTETTLVIDDFHYIEREL